MTNKQSRLYSNSIYLTFAIWGSGFLDSQGGQKHLQNLRKKCTAGKRGILNIAHYKYLCTNITRDRADRPDPKDYMYSDIEGAVIGKCPGSINGQQFLIQNCKVLLVF